MRPIVTVSIFMSWFRLGSASDVDDPTSCVIRTIQSDCFTNVTLAMECISDLNCEPDLDKACEDFASALSCSRNVAESNTACSITSPLIKASFQVWHRSLGALYNSLCVDGLIHDISQRENGVPCWDRGNFEGCIYNELRMKHVSDLLNHTQPARKCLNLLVSSVSCGILSMRKLADCESIADLPVHLVGKFFGETHCGRSDWVWNPNLSSSETEIETGTEGIDQSEAEASSTSTNQRAAALTTKLAPVEPLFNENTNSSVRLTVNLIYFIVLLIVGSTTRP